jgi:hypothetical protein
MFRQESLPARPLQPVLDAAWHQSLTNTKMQVPFTRDSLKDMRLMTAVFSLSGESTAQAAALAALCVLPRGFGS